MHLQEESSVWHQDLLSSLGAGSEREERPQMAACYRSGHGDLGLGLEERREGEELKICFPWWAWLLGSQGMPERDGR